jgi:ribosomal protein L31E
MSLKKTLSENKTKEKMKNQMTPTSHKKERNKQTSMDAILEDCTEEIIEEVYINPDNKKQKKSVRMLRKLSSQSFDEEMFMLTNELNSYQFETVANAHNHPLSVSSNHHEKNAARKAYILQDNMNNLRSFFKRC